MSHSNVLFNLGIVNALGTSTNFTLVLVLLAHKHHHWEACVLQKR